MCESYTTKHSKLIKKNNWCFNPNLGGQFMGLFWGGGGDGGGGGGGGGGGRE